MHNKQLQIVTFNNPYPPNFGGAIDMFYKIKALHNLGVKIYLHVYCFDRDDLSGIKPYCVKVFVYKKSNTLSNHFSTTPFCVKSRYSKDILKNLKSINAPILFESIRTTGVLLNETFNQPIAVRCHNIEHDYSWGLSNSEHNWLKKIAFLIEGYKLKYYEKILNNVNVLFPISHYEYAYFKKNYSPKTVFLPVFQENINIKSKNGYGNYALYHGDLAVSDNVKSALFLINVFKSLNHKLVIASSTVQNNIVKEINKYNNISYRVIETSEELDLLIENAHINVLYSFQKSGTKLKVFNALFKGRHCILNTNMVDDPEILKICTVINNKADYINAVKLLFNTEFKLCKKRQNILNNYNANLIGKKIIDNFLN